MRSLSRVVWSEGMHLAQHHFQAQSRYVENLISFALSHLFFKPYGLVRYELNAEALLNGTVSLTHARGIMPDGLPFHFPADSVPAPLEVREIFSPTRESHLVLLAISTFRPGRANATPPEGNGRQDVRFLSATEMVPDETTGLDEKPVVVAHKNFRLLLDVEVEEELVTLPLARVRRDGSGHFIYDPEYVPPCVQIGASERLLQLLGRLLEMLDARAETMRRERSRVRGSPADHSSREVVSYWLSHAIHTSLAPLRHCFQMRTVHPEQLFLELSRLAGALCTFSLHAHPRELPLYDHEDLGACFTALDRHIREQLEVIVPTSSVSIPLRQAEEHLFLGSVDDPRCFGRSRWFLGVRSSGGGAEIAARVPKLVKICSSKHIARLVTEAYPGLALEHVTSPPSQLSPRLDMQYFSIESLGPCWKSIVDTREVGVYVPAAIAEAELELAVLLER
ncbi:MAG: type VI secretion system baseplate subunit TssK [Gemmatimonadetes bacterium]|nr:type VI secretion system baseplate subunit TssK [Gemmatimonadota bacterium]